jgi:hypothetical protein
VCGYSGAKRTAIPISIRTVFRQKCSQQLYLLEKINELTVNKNTLLERKLKLELLVNTLESKTIDIEVLRQRFNHFNSIFDKLSFKDKQSIISILIEDIAVTYPQDSKKGTAKIKVRNGKLRTFDFGVNPSSSFIASGSGGSGSDRTTQWLTAYKIFIKVLRIQVRP